MGFVPIVYRLVIGRITVTIKLAAYAEKLYLELAFQERLKRIADHGFLVEIWDWSNVEKG